MTVRVLLIIIPSLYVAARVRSVDQRIGRMAEMNRFIPGVGGCGEESGHVLDGSQVGLGERGFRGILNLKKKGKFMIR